jgi:tripartite-type tricarboxylate transporter receptor subunit TctC
MAATTLWLGATSSAILIAGAVSAQDFPSKPIRIVTFAPGGGTDFASRVIAQGLYAQLGWQVVVDNRPGNMQGELLVKSAADGYTLLLNGASLWLAPFMQDNVGYDPLRDFAAVTIAASSPNVLVVHPSLPVKSVKELISLAKNRPGEIDYASGVSGSPNHLAGELLNSMAGIRTVRIPYRGAGPAVSALIGGQVQYQFAASGAVASHMASGRLRGLAVTSAQPSPLLPGLPTVAATLPGYEIVSIHGIFAPAKTPPATIDRLNQAILQVLKRNDIREKFSNAGAEVVGSTPDQLAATVKAEMQRLGKVIRDAGIRAE